MLSLAMIVQNEVQTIERTIASVKEYVDEVVVGMDVTSSDGTREIVERLADKVLDIHLSDELAKKGSIDVDPNWGFSKARNAVFDACKEDNWRLVLDGHETILNPERMKEAFETAKKTGCDGVEIWMHFEPHNGIPQRMFGTTRFMAPSVRYNNPQHNVAVTRRLHVDHAVVVEHRKSDQAPEDKKARDAQRSDATIKGFEQEVKEKPSNARSWFYLGNAYKENGLYGKAINAYQECLKFSAWNEERWHARANMGACYSYLDYAERVKAEKIKDPKHKNKAEEKAFFNRVCAREQFVLALEEFPAMAEAYYWLGDLAYKQRRYREAEVWLKQCVELPMPNCKLFMSPKVYLSDRYDLLAMVYSHLGQYGRAIDFARKALEAAPNERIEKNIRVWREHLDKFKGEYYDKIWGQKRAVSTQETQRLAVMASGMENANKVLDVGSGPGDIMEFLPDSVEYVGVDISTC